MGLPSNVARYDSVDLPEFDQLELYHSLKPAGARGTAWGKLRATEHGLLAFDWVVHAVRKPGHCVTLINYLAGAFLLSFEATLQILYYEHKPHLPNGLDAWLASRKEYSLLVRGLRTLRHLDAHVRSSQLTADYARAAHSRFASGVDPGSTVAWQLPPISTTELSQLARPKLAASELPAWDAMVGASFAADLMRQGLVNLSKIVEASEGLFP